jgi:hypothetical protein
MGESKLEKKTSSTVERCRFWTCFWLVSRCTDAVAHVFFSFPKGTKMHQKWQHESTCTRAEGFCKATSTFLVRFGCGLRASSS